MEPRRLGRQVGLVRLEGLGLLLLLEAQGRHRLGIRSQACVACDV